MNPDTFVMVRKCQCLSETIEIQTAHDFFHKKKVLEVMTHNGYVQVKNISEQNYEGNMFRIHCNRGIVEVAETVKLLNTSLNLIDPINSLNSDLLHAPLKMDHGLSRRKCCTFSRIAAEWQFQYIYNPIILMDRDDKYHVESATKDIDNKVFLVEPILNKSKTIYSIELENGFHQAGIGNLVIKSCLKNT